MLAAKFDELNSLMNDFREMFYTKLPDDPKIEGSSFFKPNISSQLIWEYVKGYESLRSDDRKEMSNGASINEAELLLKKIEQKSHEISKWIDDKGSCVELDKWKRHIRRGKHGGSIYRNSFDIIEYEEDLSLEQIDLINELFLIHCDGLLMKKEKDALFQFESITNRFNFYFKVKSVLFRDENTFFSVLYKPESSSSKRKVANNFNSKDQIVECLSSWKKLVDRYESTYVNIGNQLPNIHRYDSEFQEYFRFVDDEEKFNSFTIKQQLLIDKYLESILMLLEKEKNENPEEEIEIEEIINDTKELKRDQSKLGKKGFRDRLTKIWAKARMIRVDLGFKLVKKYLQDTGYDILKDYGKEGINKLIEIGKSFLIDLM